MLPTSRVRRPSRVLLLVLLLLALAPPAYLLQTGGALTTGYEIQELERERTAWTNRNQQLEVEIARARSLVWVEHEAVYRLGMQRPEQHILVRMEQPVPAPPEPRLLRRDAGPTMAAPVEEGPRWLDSLGSFLATFGRSE
jgi:hypothetical protein